MIKNLFYRTILVASFLTTASCGSKVKNPNPTEVDPDQVISRIDDMSARPSWLKESEPMRFEGGNVLSLGSATIPGEDGIDAAYRIAENNAKAGIASAIEQRLEFIFQNAEEGTQVGAEQARYIGAEATSLVTSSIRPHKRYWEKVASTQDTGARITTYRVFSMVSMPEAEFKKAIMKAIRKAEGKKGISKDFSKKVDKHWDKFTADIPSTGAPQTSVE